MLFKSMPCGKPLFFPSKQYITTVFYSFVGTVVSRKLQQCNRCHRQTSITAGTIFDSTKLALTLWFQAIYLMTQDKKGVSAMKLHRHLGISYNAGGACATS